ncbi:L,D-transpeptidase family protein, partial [Oleiphilus sp. HI0080]|uniref:L,D-transpeptidase family protein n=1 Tax=Oleiphilus sp. HI0080 TaxID=1822255 RepID=UPI0018D3E02A
MNTKPLLVIPILLWACVSEAQELLWRGDSDVIGQITRTASLPKDTLYDIGMAHDVGFNEMRDANPTIDAWLPALGSEVVIPSKFILPSIREGVVVNLREYRLYFFPEDGSKVITYPVGIGAEESPSPVINTRVKLKIEQPNWYPPESVREEYFEEHGKKMDWVVYPGPENPLGPFAIQLDLPEYFIHGTNKPFGIGTKVSRGCIRMDNQDLAKFVWEVPKYTPVHFVKEAVKVGLAGEELFVELHFDDEAHA